MSFTLGLYGSSGTSPITQVEGTSAVTASTQDGFASGTYSKFAIAADGTVNATYTNGQTLAVGQLAMANVANLAGLQQLGNGDNATTLASGTATVGASGTAGLGTMG